MTNPTFPPALPLPIPQSSIDRALRLARVQPPETAVRVYRNAIAVLIVSNYCSMMGFDLDLEASDALDPAVGLTLDTANLVLTGIGTIECRTVTADEIQCEIPPEACCDRVAYVVIGLDPNSRQAKLLGFAATVQDYVLPLAQLQSIDDFGAYLLRLETTQQAQPVALWQWFKGGFQQGWQDLEEWLDQAGDDACALLMPPIASAGVLRSPSSRYNIAPEERKASAVKTIVLGDGVDRVSVLVSLDLERFESEVLDRSEMAGRSDPSVISEFAAITISAVIQPPTSRTADAANTPNEFTNEFTNQLTESSPLLLDTLTLSILDLSDRELASDSVTGVFGSKPERLSVEFEISVGTIFAVRIELGNISVTESLVV
jgi:hypothetical protein